MVGDANGDGVANAKDMAILMQNLGKAGTRAQGDFDGNGLVDFKDIDLLNTYFGRKQPAAFFGKIADNTTLMPGGAANFAQLNTPVMDHSGNLAFLGVGSVNNGIYRWSAGALTRVADLSTPIPLGSGNFTQFGQPTISSGKLAFRGLGNSQDGIYSFVSGALGKVLGKGTARPDGGTITALSDPAMQNSTLTFMDTGNPMDVHAYAYSGGTITPVVAMSAAIPGGTGSFDAGLDIPMTDGSAYWFVGKGVGQFGIYKKSGGTISVVLDKNSTVPGTATTFGYAGGLSQDGANLAFFGKLGLDKGFYSISPAGTLSKIADNRMNIPGGNGRFSLFDTISEGGSSAAFVGYDAASHPGIYAWINGELNRVIDSSVMLNGKMISALHITRNAVVGNKIAFSADFTDGTTGIFSAALLPTRLPGDINNDGTVDSTDFAILQQAVGKTGSRARGDLNGDGVVNVNDFQLLEQNFGKSGFAPLLGDANFDGVVDNNDLKVLFGNMGKFGSIAQGDFNNDGRIDFNDYQIMELNMGKTLGTAYEPFGTMLPSAGDAVAADPFALVPEPGTAGVLVLGMVCAGAFGRRGRGKAKKS